MFCDISKKTISSLLLFMVTLYMQPNPIKCVLKIAEYLAVRMKNSVQRDAKEQAVSSARSALTSKSRAKDASNALKKRTRSNTPIASAAENTTRTEYGNHQKKVWAWVTCSTN